MYGSISWPRRKAAQQDCVIWSLQSKRLSSTVIETSSSWKVELQPGVLFSKHCFNTRVDTLFWSCFTFFFQYWLNNDKKISKQIGGEYKFWFHFTIWSVNYSWNPCEVKTWSKKVWRALHVEERGEDSMTRQCCFICFVDRLLELLLSACEPQNDNLPQTTDGWNWWIL